MRKASLFERLFISLVLCALLFLPQTAEVFDLRRVWHFSKSVFPSLSRRGSRAHSCVQREGFLAVSAVSIYETQVLPKHGASHKLQPTNKNDLLRLALRAAVSSTLTRHAEQVACFTV